MSMNVNAERDHPTIHLYGPRGLRQFVRTSLLLSQSELRFKYAVHELIPVTEQLDERAEVRLSRGYAVLKNQKKG